MPIYEYECRKCGEKFECLRHLSDTDDALTCPKCGAPKPRRIVSVFAGSAGSGTTCRPAPSGSG